MIELSSEEGNDARKKINDLMERYVARNGRACDDKNLETMEKISETREEMKWASECMNKTLKYNL